MLAKSLYRHSNGKVGLARTGRSYSEHDRIFLDSFNIPLLPDGTRAQYLARRCDTDTIAFKLLKLFKSTLRSHGGNISHSLTVKSPALIIHIHKSLYRLVSFLNVGFFADNFQLAVTAHDRNRIFLLNMAQIAVKAAKKLRHITCINEFFRH